VIIIETLAHKLAEKIALQLEYDEDKKAVIAYGLIAILQMITIFIIITAIGLIFDFWFESMIIFMGVGLIRKSTGGAHAKTMNGCIIISVLSVTMLSALSRYLFGLPVNIYINLAVTIFIFMISFIIFYLRVPVDSPNKPIVKPEKIKRLRKQSFILLTLFFMMTVAAIVLTTSSYQRFYSIAVSLRFTILWQLLTLTKSGALLLGKIDSQITRILEKEKSLSKV
jgi:accessory gene regulator B